ncbi:hypothetical protein BDW62DRAFT_128829 [Aspergillus aurantiobrunneus]
MKINYGEGAEGRGKQKGELLLGTWKRLVTGSILRIVIPMDTVQRQFRRTGIEERWGRALSPLFLCGQLVKLLLGFWILIPTGALSIALGIVGTVIFSRSIRPTL